MHRLKSASLLLSLVLIVTAFTGCSSGNVKSDGSNSQNDASAQNSATGAFDQNRVIHAGQDVLATLNPDDYEGTVYGIKSLAFMKFDRAPIYTVVPADGVEFSVYADGYVRYYISAEFIQEHLTEDIPSDEGYMSVELRTAYPTTNPDIPFTLFMSPLRLSDSKRISYFSGFGTDGYGCGTADVENGLGVFADANLRTPDGGLLVTRRFSLNATAEATDDPMRLPVSLDFKIIQYSPREYTELPEMSIPIAQEQIHFYEQEPRPYQLNPIVDALYNSDDPFSVLTEQYGEASRDEYSIYHFESAGLSFNEDYCVLSGKLGALIDNCPDIITTGELFYLFQDGCEFPSVVSNGYEYCCNYLGYRGAEPESIFISSTSDGTYTPNCSFVLHLQ